MKKTQQVQIERARNDAKFQERIAVAMERYKKLLRKLAR